MKKFTVTTVIMFAVILSSTASAQFFSFGIGGGLTNVVGSEVYTNKIMEGGGGGLGFSTEWNGGVIAKLGLPLVPIKSRAFILYHSLTGKGEGLWPAKVTSISSTEIEYSQSILSVGLGVQYGFIPIPVGVDPYLAIDLLYNNFGEFKTNTWGYETTKDGYSRLGLGFGVGAELSLLPVLNIDVLVSDQMMNLVGKEEGEPSLSTLTLDAFLLFSFL